MLSQESVRLSKKDLKTYKVVEKFRSGTYSREQAALKLCVSARTVSRKARSLRESGIEGLIHGNRGKSARSRKSETIRQWYVDLYKEKYYDFNVLFMRTNVFNNASTLI